MEKIEGAMLERAKLAAAEAWYGYTETPFQPLPSLPDKMHSVVCAVLSALLPPSEEMVEAAARMELFANCSWDGDRARLLPDTSSVPGIEAVFTAMIQAALK